MRGRGAASPVVAGNVYDKYGTRNPIAHFLIREFDRGMEALIAGLKDVSTILEIGCGEGEVTRKLARMFPGARVVGSDVSPEIVEEARARHPDLHFEVRSVFEIDTRERFDLVVASEVLEHVEDPTGALRIMAAISGSHIFASVPREPLWRIANCLRGKYLRRLGNTPGHVQHWNSSGFLRFLRAEVDVVSVRRPIMWTQALCKPRHR